MDRRIALSLAGRCGLRAAEVTAVRPRDVVNGAAGRHVRVVDGKGGKTRSPPCPATLASEIDAWAQAHSLDPDDHVVDVTTRTLRRWVEKRANELRAETHDEGWQYVGPHDLRRSWGQALLESDVEPGMVMEWGGWADWETFREHYLGAYSGKAEREQAAKVGWL